MRAFAAFALITLAACATPQDLPPPALPQAAPVRFFPQARAPANAEMQALARGELAAVDGCLRVRSGESADGSVIVWPAEAELTQNGAAAQVRNGRNGAMVRLGERIEMSGGYVDAVDASALRAPIPAQCPGPYWIAGSEWRLARD